MNLHYQHRWFYALTISLSLIILGYIEYLHADMMEVKKLQQQIQFLSQQARITPTATTLQKSYMKPTDFLSDFVQNVQNLGLMTQSINIKPINVNNQHGMEIQLTMTGNFQQWQKLSLNFVKLKNSLFLKNFHINAVDDNLLIDAVFWYFPEVLFEQNRLDENKFSVMQSNPFCQAESVNPGLQSDPAIQTYQFTLNELHLVGFLKSSQVQYAFIQLPNKQIISASLGSVLGSEHAVMTHIASDHIVFFTRDKQRIVVVLDKKKV